MTMMRVARPAALLLPIMLLSFVFAGCGDGGSDSGDAVPPGSGTSTTSTTSSSTSTVVFELPDLGSVTDAPASTLARFPWGNEPGSVGFYAPDGEGSTAGPAAFTIVDDGTILVFDNWNHRVVESADGAVTEWAVPLSSPAVQAAFDRSGALAVADFGTIRVLARGGAELVTVDGIGAVSRLEFDDLGVWTRSSSERTLIVARDGDSLVPVATPRSEPAPVRVALNGGSVQVSVSGDSGPGSWELQGLVVRGAQLYELDGNGGVVLVLLLDEPTQTRDQLSSYLVVQLTRDEEMRLARIQAPSGYLDNGPLFRIDDDHVDVLSSTTSYGVRVERYSF